MLVQVRRLGTWVTESEEELERARAHFAHQHYLRLPDLLEPDLLQRAQSELDRSSFYDGTHGGMCLELCPTPGPPSGLLEFLFNSHTLHDLVERVCECGPIGSFTGRVYRMVPGSGHYDSWHQDVGQDRLIG